VLLENEDILQEICKHME